MVVAALADLKFGVYDSYPDFPESFFFLFFSDCSLFSGTCIGLIGEKSRISGERAWTAPIRRF